MVFGLDRQTLVGRIEGRAFGDGPRFQRPINLQPEVVVQAPRGMFLDHEKRAGLRGFFPRGLRGAVEASFAAVDRKRTRLNSSHGYISYCGFCFKKKKETTS